MSKPKPSWSLRSWILLKELGIPFEEKQVDYLDDWQEQCAQFLKFSLNSKIPVLYHNGEIIWDGLAIVEYITEEYPQVWAEDKVSRVWSRSTSAEMHSSFAELQEICSFDSLASKPLAQIPEIVKQELKRINQLWEEGLNRF